MSALAPRLEAFFTERLGRQLQASPHTVAAYRDTFRLLLRFASSRSGKEPSELDFVDIDGEVVGAFLEHLEHERHNGVVTRNARLAAIRSFFRFAAYYEPAHADLISRVLAIPEKRTRRTVVSFLTPAEVEALLDSPDRTTWHGRRDHALLVTACQTGLRVGELRGLQNRAVELGTGAHVRVHGKGRKDRCTPLTAHTVAVLGVWMRERQGEPDNPLFPDDHRQSPQPRRCLGPRRQARSSRRASLSDAVGQAGHASRAAPLERHGAAGRRGGHLGDRPLARTRARPDDPDLSAR